MALAVIMMTLAAGWTVICGVALYLASWKVAQYEKVRPGSAGMYCGVVPLGYAMVLIAGGWLVLIAIAAGVWMLQRADLARQGRITLACVAVRTAIPLWSAALAALVHA
jgi:hypothetical protein